jgi:two-component system, OmpR family, phosphate regulon sensor histidine kinase PhoR
MTALNIILIVALLATLGWALWLLRHLRTAGQREQIPAEEFPPLFRAATGALDAGLIVLDEDRVIHYLNPQAEALLDTSSTSAIGQSLITVVRDHEADTLVSEALRESEAHEMVLRPLLSGRTLRLRAQPLDTDGMRGAVLSIRDVTQLSMLERARRDMVANVSHELRTPLASVKLLVETLQSEPPAAIAQRMLSQMAQEVDAVTQLVDELHELSQIESGRVALQLTPAALEPVVARALERIRPQAERKSLHISAQVPDTLPLALMDANRIGQVLLNLLHNAVKFTPADGDISIRAFVITIGPEMRRVGYVERRLGSMATFVDPPAVAAERRRMAAPPLVHQGRPTVNIPQPLPPGDWLLVTIADGGIGIPPEDLPRIFERFYKVDRARTRNASGTGLGLAIAKHLIEGHGGSIWATSAEGAGSTFFFALPIA